MLLHVYSAVGGYFMFVMVCGFMLFLFKTKVTCVTLIGPTGKHTIAKYESFFAKEKIIAAREVQAILKAVAPHLGK